MKKTISLTEDQMLELEVAVQSAIEQMKGSQQFYLKQADEKGAAKWGERVRTLEQVQGKIEKGKWK